MVSRTVEVFQLYRLVPVWTHLDVFAVSREVHLDHNAWNVLAVTDSIE